jgi:anti-anti-sigma factor
MYMTTLSSGFSVSSTLTERGMIVALVGRSSGAGDDSKLKNEMLRICAATPKVLVLDLAGLTDLNSAVLGALLLCLRLTTAYDGRLRLAGVRPNVLDVLERSKLTPLFDCWPDRESALAAK